MGKEEASKEIQRSIAYTFTAKEADKFGQMYADWVSPLEISNAVASGHEKGNDVLNKSLGRAVGPKLVFIQTTDAFGARTRKEHLIADPCEKWWAQTTSLLKSLAFSKEGDTEATTERAKKAASKQKETIHKVCATIG